jgi:hypothetical protein
MYIANSLLKGRRRGLILSDRRRRQIIDGKRSALRLLLTPECEAVRNRICNRHLIGCDFAFCIFPVTINPDAHKETCDQNQNHLISAFSRRGNAGQNLQPLLSSSQRCIAARAEHPYV